MRKRLAKMIALLLAAALLGALTAGCGGGNGEGTTPPASEPAGNESPAGNDAPPEGSKGKIGYNYLVTGDFALDTLANNTKRAIEGAGYEAMGVCANGALDQTITDIENMIAAGVDGLVLWLPVDSMYLTAAEKCEAAGVPFVLADKVPTDASILEQLYGYKTFAGAIAPDNYAHGTHAAEVALENGWKNALIIAPGIGDGTATPRIEAFKETFEAAGGTILGEVHTDDQNEAVTKTEDLYLAHPEAEFFFCTGASTFGTSALNVLEKYGDHDRKIITCELDATIVESMNTDDYVISDTGDFWVCGYLAGVMMTNYLSGNAFTMDGKPAVINNVPSFAITPQYVDFYNKHIAGDCTYSYDEIAEMQGITFDQFMEIVTSYSLPERALAKFAEGSVTAEELDAMGVEH